MKTSPFKRHPRGWCRSCDKRHLQRWLDVRNGVCYDCAMKQQEADDRDAEMRSLRGYTDEERARI